MHNITEKKPLRLLLRFGVVDLVPLAALHHLSEDIQSTDKLAIEDNLGEGCNVSSHPLFILSDVTYWASR